MGEFNPQQYLAEKNAALDAGGAEPGTQIEGFDPTAYIKQKKFGTTGQKVITGLEGAASAGSFGLSKGVETKLLGVNPEDIRAREEVNPTASTLGELGGLAASALIPGGALSTLGKVGRAAEALTGAGGLVGKGVRLATEGALYQSGNEVSKMFEQDPNQTIGSALTHIGLSALITPAIGIPAESAANYWASKMGAKLAPYLDAAKEALGKTESAIPAEADVSRSMFDPFTKELTDIAAPAEAGGRRTAIDPFTKQVIESPVSTEEATPAVQEGVSNLTKKFLKVPFGAGPLALLASGHPLPAAATAFFQHFFPEAPEAIATGLLRFIGKAQDTNPGALRAVIQTADSALMGLKSLNKAVNAIMPAGASLASNQISESNMKKLDKAAIQYQLDPSKFASLGQNLGQYEPAHASAMGSTVARAMNAINQARPVTAPQTSLDSDRVPSNTEKAQFQRTLQLVENPKNILGMIGQGSLTPKDIQTYMSVYPDMHKLISEKILNKVIETKTDGDSIPYKTRMNLSMFLGQPLDSTMTPSAIASNQIKPMQQAAAPSRPASPRKSAGNSLSSIPSLYSTPNQARSQARMSGK